MRVSFSSLRRFALAVAAFAVAGVGLLPAFSGTAEAAQVQNRYIKMSSSANAATGVSYEIGFELATATDLRGIVVDFCEETPIIGDTTCTLPGTAGFTAGAGTIGGTSGCTTNGTWTGATLNSGRTWYATNNTGTNNNLSSGADCVFTVTTFTNPDTTNTSFYARIYTYDATAGATGYTVANPDVGDTHIDDGGVALSTAAQVTVTAKVQETLSFCVYTNANCGLGGTAVALGDTNGVLTTANEYVDKNTKFNLASNAADGVVVRFKASGTLTSGGNTITAIGGTKTASAPNSEQFGLCGYRDTGDTLLTFDTLYNGDAGGGVDCEDTTQTAGTGTPGGDGGALFALDTTQAATTYGDDLATMAAGNEETGILAFMGNISPTTEAGIYTSVFTFIATGTY